jgi:multidrug efflux pump subunit AcrA (membrane-fusion protein)
MAIPTDSRSPSVSANGDLVNRVQQLRLGDQLGTGNRRSRGSWLPWVLCALLALTWLSVSIRGTKWAGTKTDDGSAPAPGATAPSASAPRAGDAPPAVAPGEIVFQLKGNLIPFLQLTLSPIDVGGEVIEINFKEGDRVQKDKVLARLRDTRYRNEYNLASASYEATVQRYRDHLPEAVRLAEKQEIVAQIKEAEAIKKNAELQLELVKSARETGGSSLQDLYKADADLNAAVERVNRLKKTHELLLMGSRPEKIAAAKSDMLAAEARMKEAKRMLDNCEIKAPIDGVILTKSADKGTLVSPMSFNVASGVCTMADLAQLEVEVDVPERQIVKVRKGLDCAITADADPSKVYRGYVDRVMPIADDSKNVIKVRVRVILPQGEVPGSLLRPKMSVVVVAYNRDFAWQPNDQKWE